MNYSISPDRRLLTITADADERAELAALGESIHSDSTLHDSLEHITCNSELEWVFPYETGDLTDAPMLGIFGEEGLKEHTVFAPNHGLRDTGFNGHNTTAVPIVERWAYIGYELRSFLEVLRDEGKIVLTNGE